MIVEPDKIHDAVDLAVQMQLLSLEINIARKDVVQNDIFNEIRLVVLFVVQSLYAGEGNGEQPGDMLGVVPGPFDEDDIFRLPVRTERLVGTTVVHDCARGIRSRLEYGPVGLADAGQLTACDDYALVVDYADGAVKLFFHLIDKALQRLIRLLLILQ